jgi:hypothetical protein
MDLVVDSGGVVFPASASHALERAVREALAGEERTIAKLELRLTHLRAGGRPWLCAARMTSVDGRHSAVEMRGASATAAAITAAHALAYPLKRVG